MNRKKLLEVARRSPLFRSIGDRQLRQILGHFHLHRLDKGDYLFRADQRSRVMYIVAEGKLRVEKVALENQIVRIAALTPGDIVGEVALLTGEKHSGQVRALTDATLAGIAKKELDPLLRHHPRLLQNLTRIEALRLRHNIVRENKKPDDLGFIVHLYFTTPSDFRAAAPPVVAALTAQRLKALRILDHRFLQLGQTGVAEKLRRRVSQMLIRNPSAYLYLDVSALPADLIQALVKLADRLVVTLSEDKASVEAAHKVLQHKTVTDRLAVLNPLITTIHHASRDHFLVSEIEKSIRMPVKWRLKLPKDFWERDEVKSVTMQSVTIARAICGTSQGIAFGGGGARALSEIGVISELERYRIEFDHVAGTSMGSLIAALYAQGLTSREMSEKFVRFLPTDKGLLRYNLPFISFFRDKNVNRILRRLFGRQRIEDLPKPLTIIAADLISGQEIRIRKGLVWRAVRASMSLPVIFPPVKYHGYYLVDGGAINNVPGNALREQGVERILGINCTPLEDSTIKDYLIETNLFQLLKPGEKFWTNLKRVLKALRLFFTRPPILQIANRAMMLEGSELIKQKSREFDLLLSPDVARFGLFEFERREEIIDAGRYYTRDHTTDLKKLFRRN
ncbi:MAG: patatin-like phospholipase family protein [Leptospiraceae bacterium]|nr:patatin-like phospholipase family protein [Leptospiraceae bacterium]